MRFGIWLGVWGLVGGFFKGGFPKSTQLRPLFQMRLPIASKTPI